MSPLPKESIFVLVFMSRRCFGLSSVRMIHSSIPSLPLVGRRLVAISILSFDVLWSSMARIGLFVGSVVTGFTLRVFFE